MNQLPVDEFIFVVVYVCDYHAHSMIQETVEVPRGT